MGSQFPFYSEVGTGPAESRLLAAGGETHVSAEAPTGRTGR